MSGLFIYIVGGAFVCIVKEKWIQITWNEQL